MGHFYETRAEARQAARDMGDCLARDGRHATDPRGLLPWLPGFTYWPDVLADLGGEAALAAVFEGYKEAQR